MDKYISRKQPQRRHLYLHTCKHRHIDEEKHVLCLSMNRIFKLSFIEYLDRLWILLSLAMHSETLINY